MDPTTNSPKRRRRLKGAHWADPRGPHSLKRQLLLSAICLLLVTYVLSNGFSVQADSAHAVPTRPEVESRESPLPLQERSVDADRRLPLQPPHCIRRAELDEASVANASIEELDAAETVRPDLWWAAESNLPGLPDRDLARRPLSQERAAVESARLKLSTLGRGDSRLASAPVRRLALSE